MDRETLSAGSILLIAMTLFGTAAYHAGKMGEQTRKIEAKAEAAPVVPPRFEAQNQMLRDRTDYSPPVRLICVKDRETGREWMMIDGWPAIELRAGR